MEQLNEQGLYVVDQFIRATERTHVDELFEKFTSQNAIHDP